MNASYGHETEQVEAAKKKRGDSSITDALEKIYNTCKSMTGATCGYVALKNDDGSLNELLFLDHGGLPRSVDPDLPMPIRGLRANACKLGQVVYKNDFMNSEWAAFMPPAHLELTNVLFAPLNINGETAGIIGLANKPSDYTPQDKTIAKAFGHVAALVLEKNQLRQKLIQKEERFELAMEATKEGLFDHDLISGHVYYSPAWKTMLGYSQEEIANKDSEWKRLTHPDDVAVTNQIIQRTLNQKRRSFAAEFRMKHKAGHWINPGIA